MIIECTSVCINGKSHTQKGASTSTETVGKKYHVLELYFRHDETQFRIIPDDTTLADKFSSHPILVTDKDFKLVSGVIPQNWEIAMRESRRYTLGPRKWIDNELWIDSFWEDWDNSLPDALKCYEEELAIIESTEDLADYLQAIVLKLSCGYFGQYIWQFEIKTLIAINKELEIDSSHRNVFFDLKKLSNETAFVVVGDADY